MYPPTAFGNEVGDSPSFVCLFNILTECWTYGKINVQNNGRTDEADRRRGSHPLTRGWHTSIIRCSNINLMNKNEGSSVFNKSLSQQYEAKGISRLITT